jgi:plastocyanin
MAMRKEPPLNERRSMMRPRHLTTRRGFVAGVSFAGVSLYGLWAVRGIAPLGFGHEAAEMGQGAAMTAASGGEHAGHGGDEGGLPIDAYRAMVEDFADRYRAADGFVEPPSVAPMAATTGSETDVGSGQDHAAMGHAPPDVFLLAERWSFLPDALRLRRGVTYRFSMMAADVAHGASFQLGIGSYVTRLRRGAFVSRDLTFTEPGTYLMYCTVYCGVGHDQMAGTVVVV